MRDLQAKLGDDWILRVSIQGEDAWLTAEKDDGSQHLEAPAADVLVDVVELLNESGGSRAERGGDPCQAGVKDSQRAREGRRPWTAPVGVGQVSCAPHPAAALGARGHRRGGEESDYRRR
jgi:hypothetical protein